MRSLGFSIEAPGQSLAGPLLQTEVATLERELRAAGVPADEWHLTAAQVATVRAILHAPITPAPA